MTTYVVLLPGAEDAWERSNPERQATVYARHEEFARVLAERGHRVTGGAELTHSRDAKQVRRDPNGRVVVTDGPYAETAEQLTGFYLVESDDLDDTVDYGAVCELVERVVTTERFQLLERLAARIAEVVLSDDRVRGVTVAVRKLRPPVAQIVATSGVRITRTRSGAGSA